MDTVSHLANELSLQNGQISAVIKLLEDGATIPFIARYRKEATGGLDDQQLRQLQERLDYLNDLNDRRKTILGSIDSQGLLTRELKHAIENAETKTRLEDLYLPFKPKRRNKAQQAREAGLEPLLDKVLDERQSTPEKLAIDFLNPEKEIHNLQDALDGARHILIERLGENAGLINRLRESMWSRGILCSKIKKGKETEGVKFKDYFDYREAVTKIPSHRALALFRAESQKILSLSVLASANDNAESMMESLVADQIPVTRRQNPTDNWLFDTASIAWKTKLRPRLESDIRSRIKESAGTEATRVFASNLRDLLLAPPAGTNTTMGLDPGIRTGVKIAIVDGTGKLIATSTIYPHAPKNQWDQSIAELYALINRHGVKLISIGNGTASRETDQLIVDLLKRHRDMEITKIIVSEAGASVYSASKLAAEEFPDLDVSLRGAVSIARRLQDPLAELVKIDPKSIGVGQYQHDVNQSQLTRSLAAVVEDCVNAVGVDVNTASPALLKQVSGINQTIAQNIVEYRNSNGPFVSRDILNNVPRLGIKAYEQAAGFLRIINGENPLDASAVHPEAYPLVETIMHKTGKPIKQLIGQNDYLKTLRAEDYIDDRFGLPTVNDILLELEKPGRDPRPEFKSAKFREGVHDISDLNPGMKIEGVVTNVTNFGAFVDIGVHQDGLVHISQLADRFVKDPRDIVKAGDIVQTTVIEIDVQRRRIALTMKTKTSRNDQKTSTPKQRQSTTSTKAKKPANKFGKSAMAAAFERAQNR